MKGSGESMLTTMETWLRRSERMVHKLALDQRIQSGARVAAWGGSGFFLSAVSLSGGFQPLALGLITAVSGWRALVAALGAALGYQIFWGSAGIQGTVWAAAGCLLAVLPGKEERMEAFPLLIPALTAVMTAVAGLLFLFFRRGSPLQLFFLRVLLAPVAAWFFRRTIAHRDSVSEWVCGGIGVLALASLGPLGYGLAAVFSVWGSFPAAAGGAGA